MPELKRVIVVRGEKVAMAETLDLALLEAFAGTEDLVSRENGDTPRVVSTSERMGTLARRAMFEYIAAQERLRDGNFKGYGESIDRLGRILEEMHERADAD